MQKCIVQTGLILSLFLTISSVFGAAATPVYFSDCAYVDLRNIDGDEMTRKERASALEADLFGSLDKTEECMNTAAAAGASEVAQAAGGQGTGQTNAGGQAGSGDADKSTAETDPAVQTESPQSQQVADTTPPSKRSQGGPARSGSSAVCDAVMAGLQKATTKQEKTHFEQLKTQYGC